MKTVQPLHTPASSRLGNKSPAMSGNGTWTCGAVLGCASKPNRAKLLPCIALLLLLLLLLALVPSAWSTHCQPVYAAGLCMAQVRHAGAASTPVRSQS